VEWVESSEVSAVLSKWLINDEEGDWSFWPSTKPTCDGDRPIEQLWKSKTDWSKYRVREIGHAGANQILF